MIKSIRIKALVLLIVMMYLNLFVVPVSNAAWYATQKGMVRLVYNAAAPSAVGVASNAGKAMLVGWKAASIVGLAYVLYDSGALTKIWNWWNNTQGAFNPNPNGQDWYHKEGTNGHAHIYFASGSWGLATYTNNTCPGSWVPATRQCTGSTVQNSWWPLASAQAAYQQYMGVPYQADPPDVPTDYSDPSGTETGLGNNEVHGTPGAGAGLAANPLPTVINVAFLTQSEADALKASLGMTPINSQTGAQPGSTPTDNTVTQGDSNTQSALQSILGVLISIKDYTYNLIGIKTDTGNISNKMDNVAQGIATQTEAITGMASGMDNMVTSLGEIKTESVQIKEATQRVSDNLVKIDNNIEQIKNILVPVDNTSIEGRWQNFWNVASGRFPFSVGAWMTSLSTVTEPVVTPIELPGWKLGGLASAQVENRLLDLFAPLFAIFRQLEVTLIYGVTVVLIWRKVENILG